MKKLIFASLVIIVILFAVNIYFYTIMPENIITHWDSLGRANGSMTKFFGLFLLPLIALGIFLLFIFIPKIDPLKENIKKFSTYYNSFILVFLAFLAYIDALTIIWNLGININMNLMLIPAVGFLFIYIGFILKNVKQNWFIGIRTPWTLSSEKVWKKTHDLASKLFIISGIITFLGIFFPNQMIWFILAPVIISSIVLIAYSYIEFKK